MYVDTKIRACCLIGLKASYFLHDFKIYNSRLHCLSMYSIIELKKLINLNCLLSEEVTVIFMM